MPSRLTLLVLLINGAIAIPTVSATDKSFPDLETVSSSKQYELQAASPDNMPAAKAKALFGHPTWQSNFTYTLTDAKTNRVLWTRKQNEASPVALYVSDLGWTAIFTGSDELVIVDASGKDRGLIKLLKEGFKDDESKSHIIHGSGGPRWTPRSLWCFFELSDSRHLSIRPWWGKRLFVDLEHGKLIDETTELLKGAVDAEKKCVLDRLAESVKTYEEWQYAWEKPELTERVLAYESAAFVAGTNQIGEAIPFLERLQESRNVGKFSGGGIVNKPCYTLSTRQVVQLSLRRLSRSPKPLACNGFVEDVGRDARDKYFDKFEEAGKSRRANVAQIVPKMELMEVIKLLGAPDYVLWNRWEYDIDGDEPFTLIIKLDAKSVREVERKTPPAWKKKTTERDYDLIFG